MTRFQQGDKVRASVTAQGLTKGAEYVIVDVQSQELGIFGTLVTYIVADRDGRPVDVTNGHLLLAEVR